jgi:hypothetical protein
MWHGADLLLRVHSAKVTVKAGFAELTHEWLFVNLEAPQNPELLPSVKPQAWGSVVFISDSAFLLWLWFF